MPEPVTAVMAPPPPPPPTPPPRQFVPRPLNLGARPGTTAPPGQLAFRSLPRPEPPTPYDDDMRALRHYLAGTGPTPSL